MVKNLPANAGDTDSIPGSGRYPGGGNGNSLQHSCLKNPIDRSLVGYSPWGHRESDMADRFSLIICKTDNAYFSRVVMRIQ